MATTAPSPPTTTIDDYDPKIKIPKRLFFLAGEEHTYTRKFDFLKSFWVKINHYFLQYASASAHTHTCAHTEYGTWRVRFQWILRKTERRFLFCFLLCDWSDGYALSLPWNFCFYFLFIQYLLRSGFFSSYFYFGDANAAAVATAAYTIKRESHTADRWK